jgi:hypothetical protein
MQNCENHTAITAFQTTALRFPLFDDLHEKETIILNETHIGAQ